MPYVAVLWLTGLRKAPKLSVANVKTLTPSAICHLGTHVGAVLSLGAGAVSFTHIVKVWRLHNPDQELQNQLDLRDAAAQREEEERKLQEVCLALF